MPARASRAIICECGHTGALCLAENDPPDSSLWVSYELEGFSRGRFVVTNSRDAPSTVLAQLQPKCPECGQVGKVKFV